MGPRLFGFPGVRQRAIYDPFGTYRLYSRKYGCLCLARTYWCFPCLLVGRNAIEKLFQFHHTVSHAGIFLKEGQEGLHSFHNRHVFRGLDLAYLQSHLPRFNDLPFASFRDRNTTLHCCHSCPGCRITLRDFFCFCLCAP